MRKGDEFGWFCSATDWFCDATGGVGAGAGIGWLDIQIPEFGGWCSVSRHDEVVVMSDGDCGCCELDFTASIAELPDGEQGLGGQLWDDVAVVCCEW